MVGACKGISDLLQFHFKESFFNDLDSDFWNPELSWYNKWAVNKWGLADTSKERFWGSSRWFVFITDGWHTMQFFMIKFIFLSVLTVWWLNPEFNWYDLTGICSFYAGFWVTYESKLLRM